MATITLNCPICGTDFQKSKKEHTRRTKAGFSVFYCSLRCAGVVNAKNFPAGWITSAENIQLLKQNAAIAAVLNRKYPIEDQPFYEYYRRAKMRKKQTFDLTVGYLRELWSSQNGRCVLSGIPLKHPEETQDLNVMGSLDRKDSSKGYVIGNVQFVSCALNLAKRERSDESIMKLIALLIEHNSSTA